MTDNPNSVHAWITRAREQAEATGIDVEEIVPGVMLAEAKAAAAHAVVIQGGYSTPEIEAQRLAADRGVKP